ncbi:hypothetical protein PF005_g6830 [Phytophthora fragariae]|uniref:Uncharacterized protein n=2 Tax=Phytophthora TaxID=4783 RepID=A0A6A4DHZ8_9STRA|nr:hypothetical protein PF003_g9963 [Phytophthora fragariae]KAE9027430.1 hypothetical protein PR002_g10667 [Phytophthora rubi]KAE8945346.1 hypothetical protein PF009_g5015 [Phytophthora fragariae]KAE9008970.1 hypothetical protein PF011_g10485 [Phytophthora fragariae]KAE9032697.1 hypothetical protein PR001_g10496 [Phytophthora rubi]
MVCTLEEALDVLKQLQSSPELSPHQNSLVLTLSIALESFAGMETHFAAIDAELTSTTAFLASSEAEFLPMEALASRLQEVVAIERGIPDAEYALSDLWEVGPFLRSMVSMISSWLPVAQVFLQPDDIPREIARLRLMLYDVVQRVRNMRGLLESLEALASLGGAIESINLKS